MVINTFEDIISWQKSRELVNIVYDVFLNCRDFSFKDQIYRASISVMNNIAEGFERRSNKDFRRFLFISKGSCAEVRSMIYIATDRKYISSENSTKIYNLCNEISKLESALIKTL